MSVQREMNMNLDLLAKLKSLSKRARAETETIETIVLSADLDQLDQYVSNMEAACRTALALDAHYTKADKPAAKAETPAPAAEKPVIAEEPMAATTDEEATTAPAPEKPKRNSNKNKNKKTETTPADQQEKMNLFAEQTEETAKTDKPEDETPPVIDDDDLDFLD